MQVHKGFFIAQDNVLHLLTVVLNEQKEQKNELRRINQNTDKQKRDQIKKSIKMIKYQEGVLRKIIDSIAWQIFQYDTSMVRRLYCGKTVIDITDSNISSELSYIDDFKKETPLGFALISDLSSFIQIGDITTIDPEKFSTKIIELKEGAINHKVFEFINDVTTNSCPLYFKYKLNEENDKFKEHVKRNMKQIRKMGEVSQVINTGCGTDLLTGAPIRIFENDIELNTFDDIICKLAEKCHIRGYAIDTVEDIVLIGVYDTRKFSPKVFDFWVESVGINSEIFDLRQSFFIPCAYPVFLHPFKDNFLIDLIAGRKVIKMAININKWLDSFKNNGCTVRFMSKKETIKKTSSIKGGVKSLFLIDGCGVEIAKNGIEYTLGDGLIGRILLEFNTPTSVRQSLLNFFEKSGED